MRLLRVKKIIFFVFLGLLSSCITIQRIFPPPVPKDFGQEIAQLETEAKESKNPADRAKIRLKLAMLHAHHKNPNRNYAMAIQELELYASLDPTGSKEDAVQNWLAVLRELQREAENHKDMQKLIEQMSKENQELKSKTEQLNKENEEKKKMIEQLKSLDIQIEEKRKQVK